MAVPGGIHLQRHHMTHRLLHMCVTDLHDTFALKRKSTHGHCRSLPFVMRHMTVLKLQHFCPFALRIWVLCPSYKQDLEAAGISCRLSYGFELLPLCCQEGRGTNLKLEEQALQGILDVRSETHIPSVRVSIHAVRIEGPVEPCNQPGCPPPVQCLQVVHNEGKLLAARAEVMLSGKLQEVYGPMVERVPAQQAPPCKGINKQK